MTYDGLVQGICVFAICVLAILVLFCLVRTVIGPRVADRMVGVNMIGTQVIVMIALVALLLDEGGLADVALIYALLSFLAVVIFTKVFTGVYDENREKAERLTTDENEKEADA